MKDTSRPRPNPSSRSTPYRKRKSSANISPVRGTRRQYDASQPQSHIHEIITSRSPDRAQSSRRPNGAQSSCAISSADGRCSFPKTGENRAVSHTWGRTSTDGSTRERPPHTSAPSAPAEVPDLFLRVLPASGPPITNGSNGQRKTESPPPGSVTAFLRSIELPDKHPSSAPPLQTSSSSTSLSLRPPSLSTNKVPCTNENGCQISLVYKGYPFMYDLAALPDDPKGTIALLTVTQSDPGAYILVGAHYRRTGRSRAACAVIRSLLNTLDTPSEAEKERGDAAFMPASGTSIVKLISSDPSCPKLELPTPAFKRTAVRPATLLLAACELDISRERPDDPESANHASTAHDLFRAVYGTVNDAIVAGALRPQPQNALGLEFPGNKDGSSFSTSDTNGQPPRSACLPEVESLARVKGLEKDLSTARAAQKKLQEELTASNGFLKRAKDKVYALESHSHEVLVQLDASRDENWELRQRLVESEQRARELVQCTPHSESRVWGKLKDLLFDNLGGGVRGE